MARNGSNGDALNQLKMPYGLSIEEDQSLIITDYGDARIISWTADATSSEVIVAGSDHLNRPAAILIDRILGNLIVSEEGNRRVMRWSLHKRDLTEGLIRSNILSLGLAMDDRGFLYVSDFERHEVRCYRGHDQEGVIVAGGNGSVYVADQSNNRVMRWPPQSKKGQILVGAQEDKPEKNPIKRPSSLAFDKNGNLYVTEFENHRNQRFDISSIE